jgi:hypothetical protein
VQAPPSDEQVQALGSKRPPPDNDYNFISNWLRGEPEGVYGVSAGARGGGVYLFDVLSAVWRRGGGGQQTPFAQELLRHQQLVGGRRTQEGVWDGCCPPGEGVKWLDVRQQAPSAQELSPLHQQLAERGARGGVLLTQGGSGVFPQSGRCWEEGAQAASAQVRRPPLTLPPPCTSCFGSFELCLAICMFPAKL